MALLLTALLLTLLLMLGLSLQLRWRRDRTRWPHHALFFMVCAALVGAMGLVMRAGGRWWALLPALALLLSMPRTQPGKANHWGRALACTGAFVFGAWVAW